MLSKLFSKNILLMLLLCFNIYPFCQVRGRSFSLERQLVGLLQDRLLSNHGKCQCHSQAQKINSTQAGSRKKDVDQGKPSFNRRLKCTTQYAPVHCTKDPNQNKQPQMPRTYQAMRKMYTCSLQGVHIKNLHIRKKGGVWMQCVPP